MIPVDFFFESSYVPELNRAIECKKFNGSTILNNAAKIAFNELLERVAHVVIVDKDIYQDMSVSSMYKDECLKKIGVQTPPYLIRIIVLPCNIYRFIIKIGNDSHRLLIRKGKTLHDVNKLLKKKGIQMGKTHTVKHGQKDIDTFTTDFESMGFVSCNNGSPNDNLLILTPMAVVQAAPITTIINTSPIANTSPTPSKKKVEATAPVTTETATVPATSDTDSPSTQATRKRTQLRKAVRMAVWNQYNGVGVGEAKCYIGCGETITPFNFECGHIVSVKNNGDDTVDNLRPICSTCNKSIGATNMDIFSETHNLKNNLNKNLVKQGGGGKKPNAEKKPKTTAAAKPKANPAPKPKTTAGTKPKTTAGTKPKTTAGTKPKTNAGTKTKPKANTAKKPSVENKLNA